jgi:hypothetical protein
VNWFSKQSAIALALSDGYKLRPEGPWIAVSALGRSVFRRDFAMCHIDWGVTSELPILISPRSSAFLKVNHLTDFVTQLTAVLHAGSLVSCHNFLSLCLCFINRSKSGSSLFMSESVTLLVDHLCAEVT